jgi:nitrate reductase NapE component
MPKEAQVESIRIRSGWVTFAAIIAGVVAIFNILGSSRQFIVGHEGAFAGLLQP